MKPILQVEDDPNDVFFLAKAMKKAGVPNPIQVATDGQMAIDYLQGGAKFANRERFPMPCLVLLDLKLPHVMGLDVLKWIRKQPGMHLIVIFLTASREETDIATAYQLGANAFLVKPSTASKLETIVKSIKDFWLTHNLPPPQCQSERCPAELRAMALDQPRGEGCAVVDAEAPFSTSANCDCEQGVRTSVTELV